MLLRDMEVNTKKLVKPAGKVNNDFLWGKENRH